MSTKNLHSMCKLIPVPAWGILRDSVSFAAQVISQGCVVGVPTDTVYGLACDAQNNLAVSRLYAIKGRDLGNPMSICVGNVTHVAQWANVKHLESGMLNALLPGPVTLVLNRSTQLNPLLNPETCKVGIRIPENKFMQELAEMCKGPLALTSANTSGHSASLETGEFRHLWPVLGAVFDAGRLGELPGQREGSTVVDLTEEGTFRILRRGIACCRTSQLLQSFGLAYCPDEERVASGHGNR